MSLKIAYGGKGLFVLTISKTLFYCFVFSVGFLSKWFEDLRDQYTKLHKRKSGDGAPQFTEHRE